MKRILNPSVGDRIDLGECKVMISVIGKRGLQLEGSVGITEHGFKSSQGDRCGHPQSCADRHGESFRGYGVTLGDSNRESPLPAAIPAAFMSCRLGTAPWQSTNRQDLTNGLTSVAQTHGSAVDSQ